MQAETLGDLERKVRRVSSLEDLPVFTGVHFSNELIDAFPVHLVKWSGSRWVELHVEIADRGFAFTDGELSEPALAERLALMPPVPGGYRTEINLAALEWIAALGAKMDRGFLLAIDYGFSRDEYHRAERTAGTLTAYAQHRRIDNVLATPGEIDLTAHVDFTSLAEHAERCGLRLAGFTDQHHFMVGLGSLHFPGTVTMDLHGTAQMRAFKMLMHPNLMGMSFKALLLVKGVAPSPPLAGFQVARDPRAALGIAALKAER
jgi:SAM-dependent MidA family methyltransferase